MIHYVSVCQVDTVIVSLRVVSFARHIIMWGQLAAFVCGYGAVYALAVLAQAKLSHSDSVSLSVTPVRLLFCRHVSLLCVTSYARMSALLDLTGRDLCRNDGMEQLLQCNDSTPPRVTTLPAAVVSSWCGGSGTVCSAVHRHFACPVLLEVRLCFAFHLRAWQSCRVE